jgi:oxalate---CoA ligase
MRCAGLSEARSSNPCHATLYLLQVPDLTHASGCDVLRLRDFIAGFYAHSFELPPQNVDDAFCAFFWNVIVQQPTVRVGVMPQGVTTEVYIAPQSSAKRKAKARGEEPVEEAPPVLDSIADAETKSLDQLKSEHGEKLRIAVDPETSFAAITGSHLRVCVSIYLFLKGLIILVSRLR